MTSLELTLVAKVETEGPLLSLLLTFLASDRQPYENIPILGPRREKAKVQNKLAFYVEHIQKVRNSRLFYVHSSC